MIKIFVGCSANTEDAESQAVLEYTLKKHSGLPVDITWMKLSKNPSSPFYGWNTTSWATPFSGFRWAVPALCNFSGQAIYMDSDIIVMDDINKLWAEPFNDGKVIMSKGGDMPWRFCVSKWNCKRAQQHLPSLENMKVNSSSHAQCIGSFKQYRNLIQEFSENWNCVDGERYDNIRDERIKAIHYSSMRHQPHLKYAIPRLDKMGLKHWFDGVPVTHWREDLIKLFDEVYAESQDNGFPIDLYTGDPLYGPYNKKSVGSVADPNWKYIPKRKLA